MSHIFKSYYNTSLMQKEGSMFYVKPFRFVEHPAKLPMFLILQYNQKVYATEK